MEFRKINDTFQTTLKADIDKIKNSDAVFVPADKSRNLYQMSKERYTKLLHENVTKHYRHAPAETCDVINTEAQKIATSLGVADRMDTLARKDAFLTLKDHKDNFANNLPCRLINPAKSEIGLISKRILDRINGELKNKLNVQQWKNSLDVTTWFTAIAEKSRCVFTCFDIREYYPSISEGLLRKAFLFARERTEISDQEMDTILHARKSLLFSGGSDWSKNNRVGTFDVTMGSFDGAEICELVGTYILATLPARYDRKNIGLYRDDGLMVHTGISGTAAERIRKELTNHFAKLGLSIIIRTNLKTTDFLDLTLDLNCGKYFPFRKPNNDPCYISKQSNHPPPILNNIPAAISRRITDTSSDQEAFNAAAPLYNDALKASGYKETISFMPERKETRSGPTERGKRRRRNVIWFNPPYCRSVRTCIGKRFLQLIDKHFPKNSPLSKIFNRNTVKISFSCMPNVASIIKSHNSRVLGCATPAPAATVTQGRGARSGPRKCNCRVPQGCPLDGNCLVSSVVYKATVMTNDNRGEVKHYFGLTEGPFKQRYNSHLTNFRHSKYRNATELSKYIWQLKDDNKVFEVKWSIQQKAPAYRAGSKRCDLCLSEKLNIITADQKSLLNKRSELVSTCRHRRKFLLSQFCAGSNG